MSQILWFQSTVFRIQWKLNGFIESIDMTKCECWNEQHPIAPATNKRISHVCIFNNNANFADPKNGANCWPSFNSKFVIWHTHTYTYTCSYEIHGDFAKVFYVYERERRKEIIIDVVKARNLQTSSWCHRNIHIEWILPPLTICTKSNCKTLTYIYIHSHTHTSNLFDRLAYEFHL